MMRIGNDRHGQFDLGIGEIGRRRKRGEIRHRIVGRKQPVGIDVAEISDRRLGAVIGLAVGDPQRLVVAAGVERVDLHPVFLVGDQMVEFAVGEFAQLVGDRRIGPGRRGGRRRGGLGAGARRRADRRCRSGRGWIGLGSGGCRLSRSGVCRCIAGGIRFWRRRCGRGALRRLGLRLGCGRGRGSRSRTDRRGADGLVARRIRRVGQGAAGGGSQQECGSGRGQQPIGNPGHYVFSLTANAAGKRIHIGISAPNYGICRLDWRGGGTLREPSEFVL